MLATAPTLRNLLPFDERHHEALVRLSRAVYGGAHEEADEWRNAEKPTSAGEPRYVVLADSGELAGYGAFSQQPWMLEVDKRGMDLMVAPTFRGQGLGDALMRRLLDDARSARLRSLDAVPHVEQGSGLAFLQSRGFMERERTWTMALEVESASSAELPLRRAMLKEAGFVFSTLAAERERDPEAFRKFHRLWVALAEEEPDYNPSAAPPYEPFVKWLENPRRMLDGTMLALRDGEFAGVCMLGSRPEEPDVLFQNTTGVLSPYRRMGLATVLKLLALQRARSGGYRRILTSNSTRNAPILALNEKLGFRREAGRVRMELIL